MSTRPKVISTFAGCGGSSLGYLWAGYEELLAIDFDSNSVEVFEQNFPRVAIWKKDIRDVTGKEILEFCNLRKGELDLLDGSPPCQGFSMSGKRQVTDLRNDLSYEFIRLLKELRPRAFVMENVSGMAKGKMKGLFKEITKSLKDAGYRVKVKLMNTKYYKVPQSRQRLIWVGVRDDLNVEPSFPTPSVKTIPIKEVYEKDVGTFLSLEDVKKIDTHANQQRSKGNSFGGTRLASNVNKVMRTITKHRSSDCLIKLDGKYRYPTLLELKRFGSFPDDFKLKSYNTGWARIGNAVMPKFMEAIALNVRYNILERNHGQDKQKTKV